MPMRLLPKLGIALVALVVWLVVLVTVASFAFNVATAGEGKPVGELWHGRFVEADGVETAYRKWGTHGSPIVLIGGFVEPSFVWSEVAPLLARSHRVYALDLDGFGYSARRGPWTLKEWGDQVQDFMRVLHIAKPIVVGHSLGAAVAVTVAQRGLASRIVLLDGDALGTGGAPSLVRDVVAHTPWVTSALRLATRWNWPAKQLLLRAYGPDHPPITDAVIDRWTRPFEANGADHAIATMATRQIAGVPRSALQSLHVQATVVWGDHDEVDPISAGRQTASDLHARFVTIKGAGHLTMLNDPAAVASAILRSP
jgi:pimeloyl-ACP methyl ester carboxylesterase